jgi:DNA-binding NtrC family response regulator
VSLALARSYSPPDPGSLVTEGKGVLVVDDDSGFRELITVRLELAGAAVYQAGNVFEAIECLERRHLDLVICDYSMPAARGTDLLAYLRRRGLPVSFVLMSGELPAEAAVDAWREDALAISKASLLRLLSHD